MVYTRIGFKAAAFLDKQLTPEEFRELMLDWQARVLADMENYTDHQLIQLAEAVVEDDVKGALRYWGEPDIAKRPLN